MGKKRRRDDVKTRPPPSSGGSDSDLATAEAQDLSDLREIASEAKEVKFDGLGRIASPSFLPADAFDAIQGLVKIAVPPPVLASLVEVHECVKSRVGAGRMVPWAGLGADTTRLRAFGFLGDEGLDRLDGSAVRLHAPEKVGADADRDEAANRAALTVLRNRWKARGEDAARDLVEALRPEEAGLPVGVVRVEELVAYQPNLHNGAEHLAAHLDWPLHEGFGKVIVTVAIRGGATILLIGRAGQGADEDEEKQPAWRFHLNEGECYVLSGRARNRCLHAVLADCCDGANSHAGERESLNLRFGLHTKEEAEEEVTRWWPDEM